MSMCVPWQRRSTIAGRACEGRTAANKQRKLRRPSFGVAAILLPIEPRKGNKCTCVLCGKIVDCFLNAWSANSTPWCGQIFEVLLRYDYCWLKECQQHANGMRIWLMDVDFIFENVWHFPVMCHNCRNEVSLLNHELTTRKANVLA